jgi:hypothetical protein
LITYKGDFQNDGTSFHGGAFVETQVTHSIRLQAAAGYQGLYFDTGGGNEDTSDLNGYYWNVSASHRLNRYISHALSVGHESTLGTNSNFVTTNYIRHHIQWDVVRRVALATDVYADFAEESGGVASQDFTSVGFVISAGYTLTEHSRLEAFYSYQFRNARGGDDRDDQNFAGDYGQNRVGVNFVYAF